MKHDNATKVKSVFDRWDSVTITRTNPLPDIDDLDRPITASDIPRDQQYVVEATRIVYSGDIGLDNYLDSATLSVSSQTDLPDEFDIDISFEPLETPHDEDAIRLTATVTNQFATGDPLPDNEQQLYDFYSALANSANVYDNDAAARLAVTYRSWDALADASDADLAEINGVGESTIETIRDYIEENKPKLSNSNPITYSS